MNHSKHFPEELFLAATDIQVFLKKWGIELDRFTIGNLVARIIKKENQRIQAAIQMNERISPLWVLEDRERLFEISEDYGWFQAVKWLVEKNISRTRLIQECQDLFEDCSCNLEQTMIAALKKLWIEHEDIDTYGIRFVDALLGVMHLGETY